MTSLAPVVLFLFNRPEHTRRTLSALVQNDIAYKTDLIVYCDGPRDERDRDAVSEVRGLAKSVKGFRSLEVVSRDANVGLSESIVHGVTEVIGQRGKVIVMEDDLLTARPFLTYMNDGLDHFAGETQVWHVAGWNHPIETENLPSFFFWSVMNCWGWGTWADRWRHYRKEPERLLREWDDTRIRAFNLDGANDFFAQVRANASGHINTWAVFWYASIFENEGLCLTPTRSFVSNIGLDGSGIHGVNYSDRDLAPHHYYNGLPELEINPNLEVIMRIQKHLRKEQSLGARISRRMSRLMMQLARQS